MPSPETNSIVEIVRENPYQYFSVAEVGTLFGFGRNTMTALINAGAPVVARKINPDALKAWLADNAGKLGKITE